MSRIKMLASTAPCECLWIVVITLAASLLISACSTTPLLPYSEETEPLVLLPISQAGIQDERGRFREIFCTVLEEHGSLLPDYQHCDQALTRVGAESKATGKKVELGTSERGLVALVVPGVGWTCFSGWLNADGSAVKHVRQFGYDMEVLQVDALSSSTNNARQIRDAIMAKSSADQLPNFVLIGYSKGAPDILEAIASYPEIHDRIAAVVSIAGAVGGSPLANDATQSDLNLLLHWPDADCSKGDEGAIDSLRPATRKTWLANNPLPKDLHYYSLVTYPKPERISSVLESSYYELSRVDARNDSQLLFYDQLIPGSTLLGYMNADHWAVVVPVARTHSVIGYLFVDQNDYPREALLEAVLRFIEEDLQSSQPGKM